MMHTDRGKVVMGVRQCGKSYLVFKLFKYYLLSHGVAEAQIFEMAFDHYGNRRYRDPKLFYQHVPTMNIMLYSFGINGLVKYE